MAARPNGGWPDGWWFRRWGRTISRVRTSAWIALISFDIKEDDMPDVLIRSFPAEDLALLDQLAARLGISRAEYLRRHLQQEARRAVTTEPPPTF